MRLGGPTAGRHAAVDAEDLAQDTFVRLYKRRRDFKAGVRLSPLLYSIASNLAKNRLRWRSVRRLVSLDGVTPDSPGFQHPDPQAASGADTAADPTVEGNAKLGESQVEFGIGE